MKEKRCLEDQLFRIGLAALPFGAALVFLYLYLNEKQLLPGFCVFSVLFGAYCPGCGGTRAFLALFQGRLLLSFWYHPLVPYGAILYTGFMFTLGVHRLGVKGFRGWRFHNWYLWAGAGILVINFLVKNFLRLGFGILL